MGGLRNDDCSIYGPGARRPGPAVRFAGRVASRLLYLDLLNTHSLSLISRRQGCDQPWFRTFFKLSFEQFFKKSSFSYRIESSKIASVAEY